MPVRLKVETNKKTPNGKPPKRRKSHLPMQKDIAEACKDDSITAEEQELIDVSMRAMQALDKEEKRVERIEKRRNSIRGKSRLPMQKDIVLPEKLSPEDEKLIEASLRVMKAMDDLEKDGFVW